MKTLFSYGLVSAVLSMGLGTAVLANPLAVVPIADAEISDSPEPQEIRLEDEALDSSTLTQGEVRVVANYQPIDYDSDMRGDNLQLQLFYDDELQLTLTEDVFLFGRITLQDLDSNGVSEVIVESFTGGAHCCMAIATYTWQDEQFNPIYFGYLDGGGGRFEDLNGDGLTEFVTVDNAFYYAFSSYAGSFPPSVILTFEDGQYTDTTPQFEDYLRSTAWTMFEVMEDLEAEDIDSNGVFAGYVAQKIRLGEYESGWDLMLARYHRDDDWGLAQYNDEGEHIGDYPDFPTALHDFLKDLGYLDADGNPQLGVNRSPVVAEREEF
jgi:hypothetical protein